MAAKSYNLMFEGYWREPNIEWLPTKSGVYCAYSCIYDVSAKTVDLKRLLHIGESDNARSRVSGHNKWSEWRNQLRSGEQICFNFAPISGGDDRERAEAAEIFKHKPPCNTEYRANFPFDRTTITNQGTVALLVPQFTVERTEDPASKRAILNPLGGDRD
jgi:hypothetical protein